MHYYEKPSFFEEGTKVGEGEILLLSPRHPDKGTKREERVTWKEALRDIDVDLEAGNWGIGPQQDAEEVDSLTFCCCDRCHGNTLQGLSNAMCGAFPQHITVTSSSRHACSEHTTLKDITHAWKLRPLSFWAPFVKWR